MAISSLLICNSSKKNKNSQPAHPPNKTSPFLLRTSLASSHVARIRLICLTDDFAPAPLLWRSIADHRISPSRCGSHTREISKFSIVLDRRDANACRCRCRCRGFPTTKKRQTLGFEVCGRHQRHHESYFAKC